MNYIDNFDFCSLVIILAIRLVMNYSFSLKVPWLSVVADRVQLDAAGVIDTGGRALNGIPQNAPDSPAAGKL